MRARRSFSRRSAPAKRRKIEWNGLVYGGTAAAGVKYSDWLRFPGSQNYNEPAGGSIQAIPDCTLVSMRALGVASAYLDAATHQYFRLGILAWDSASTNILNPADIPDGLDADAEWVVRWTFPYPKNGTLLPIYSTVGTNDATLINSRAMRKLPTNTGLLIVADAQLMSEDVQFASDWRYAIKLPW